MLTLLVVAVAVDNRLLAVLLLPLVLDEDESEMYKGWDSNDGKVGSFPEILPERTSTTHFMLGLNNGLWSVQRSPI
ncbi:hypothetical protein EPI10_020851 [Gossypium australe]|uniref:Uncharacterized protein n=1 Tax=Gossypium australe TaxID=47621 RepID=A0A5B6WHT5_9ROSI|nr:hypothetical protein EPI10_020851 [Gossypium australe]